MSGPPRKPTAWRRMEGNRGKKAWNHAEPVPPEGVPDCPEHLSDEARAEWHRLVETLTTMGVITIVDRRCWRPTARPTSVGSRRRRS